MKKYLCLSLLLVLFVNLCACSPDNSKQEGSFTETQAMDPSHDSAKEENLSTELDIENSKDLFFFTYNCFDQKNQPTTEEFFKEETSLQRLKTFHDTLTETFDFYELSTQPLEYCEYYNGDPKFCLAPDTINQKIPDGTGNDMFVTPIKALRLGEKLSPFFESEIAEGRYFSDSDFAVTGPEDEISVILGSDYQGIYQIGDVIEITLLTKDVKLKVIGFFKPGADYYKRDLLLEAAPSRIALDQLIVLPYYDILYAPTDSTDALYQSRYYLQRSSGYIKVEEGLDCSAYTEEAKELTDQVSKEGFSYVCPPEFVYYRDKVEQLSLKENVPFSISFSAIELAFSNK